jgi:hypothetical protein
MTPEFREPGWQVPCSVVWLTMAGEAVRSDVNPADPDDETARADADRTRAVPGLCTLGGFVREAGRQGGVAIGRLVPGTRLTVETRNSRYRLTLLGGAAPGVLVEGGCLFAGPTPAVLIGASAGGSLLKEGWIIPGLRMELSSEDRRVISSPVRSVTIDTIPPVH